MKDIQDDEIRIIGTSPHRKQRKRSIWLLLGIAVGLLVVGAWFWSANQEPLLPQAAKPQHNSSNAAPSSYTATTEEAVNDVPLRILTPVQTTVRLETKTPEPNDTSIVLAIQAPDIRADNGGVVCESVVDGVLLSRGVAKKGFCAIIDNTVYLGTGTQTPLLEQTIQQKGSFFRQYALVDESQMVENTPKGKAIRRALATKKGETLVIESLNRESLHDFAQALTDLGVEQAITLHGSETYGFFRNVIHQITYFGIPEPNDHIHPITYLVFRST